VRVCEGDAVVPFKIQKWAVQCHIARVVLLQLHSYKDSTACFASASQNQTACYDAWQLSKGWPSKTPGTTFQRAMETKGLDMGIALSQLLESAITEPKVQAAQKASPVKEEAYKSRLASAYTVKFCSLAASLKQRIDATVYTST